ncbi:hypothetical protein [Acinetobacter wuhouensis]|uniref:Uncharacterized protein n=1 Tax=Acinetobacter wuhouensis TaxID=1879050 RepID=A0A4Q7AGA6_9GAMM|nr:hypothetical protein [Acinetobacter wuhouensis]RZG46567.1 hypothetical protein EXU28_08255 [Acinetobacter wuhouensis]RZG72322.1 hypothetical protein EXU29_10385 [Acinetobacter wuhouensis]
MFSNGLSIFAIIISAVAAYYTYQQSELLKKQYEKQQELEKELKSYAIVIGSETDENLSKNIQNGEIIHFSFSNGSNKPVPYKVEVKSEGIGLYLDKGQPDKAYFNYPLNSKRATLIQPNGEPYRGTFSLWSFKVPSPTAKVSIWVNGEETVSYSYKYNQKTKHYDYMSE